MATAGPKVNFWGKAVILHQLSRSESTTNELRYTTVLQENVQNFDLQDLILYANTN
jgi:hypothetical protein